MKDASRIAWAVALSMALLMSAASAPGVPAPGGAPSGAPATSGEPSAAPDTVEGEWVVGVEPRKVASVVADLKAAGIDADVASPKRNRLRIDLTGEDERALRAAIGALDGVEYVAPVQRYRALAVPTDPGYDPQQWGLPKIGMPAAWDITRGAPDVTIAIVDTGVDLLHQDLQASVDTANDYDFVDNDYDASDEDAASPGHGTHVAGIAAADWDNGFNGAGVAPDCTILPVRVLDEDALGDSVWVAAGIEWAADHGADVISMSLGGVGPDIVLEDAVNYARSKDVVVVAAAGNHRDGTADSTAVMFPGAYPGVLAVGATDIADTVAAFSNFGPEVDISAPGVGIYSTKFDPATPSVHSGWISHNGTSMATPFASGAAALLRAEHPTWNEGQVRGALLDSVADLGDPGRDIYYGEGRLDVAAALAVTDPTEMTETVSPSPPYDDSMPGVRLASSPVTGTLDSVGEPRDYDDVYRVWLEPGDTLYASITGEDPVTTDFDLFLFGPDATSFVDPDATRNEGAGYYPNGVNWRAEKSGWHYIDLMAWPPTAPGAGEYTLSWAKNPQASVLQSNLTPAYGANTRIWTDFADAGSDPIVGERLQLVRWNSSLGRWDAVPGEAPEATDVTGRATFTVSPTSKTTYSAAVEAVGGTLVALTEQGATVTPHVYLGTPYPSARSVSRSKTYTWYAALRPRHTAGHKTVLFKTFRRVGGSWVYYRTFYGTNADYSSYTRSSARFRLPYAGRWKVVPWTAADAGHAQTTGPGRELTVK